MPKAVHTLHGVIKGKKVTFLFLLAQRETSHEGNTDEIGDGVFHP